MKRAFSILLLASSACLPAVAQTTSTPPTISADDMFNQVGQYYLAFSNEFDPTSLSPTYFLTGGLMGDAGPNQIWDFSHGPTNLVYRFDYIAMTNVPESIATNFPAAKLAEKKTDQSTGDADYLFFEQLSEGRKVYGAYFNNPLTDPLVVFTLPIVDFPAQITYDKKWSTSTSWETGLDFGLPPDPEDPEDVGGGGSALLRVTQTSSFHVDASGTIIPPEGLGAFGPGLRVNEEVTQVTDLFDDLIGWQNVSTDYSRNFYWLMPGRGIVAQLGSKPSQGAPPPDSFEEGTQFWRMFETNKKATSPGGGCSNPDPVGDLRIRMNNGQVLLSWTKAACATSYRVEYSSTPSDAASWKALGATSAQLLALDNAGQEKQRYYRVVSIK